MCRNLCYILTSTIFDNNTYPVSVLPWVVQYVINDAARPTGLHKWVFLSSCTLYVLEHGITSECYTGTKSRIGSTTLFRA